ncbi:MAG: lytic murein transglycosylase [Rhizobiaceae bacterium]|nr:lytic murein transglycosylase [Rhizobiaceae bacterium]
MGAGVRGMLIAVGVAAATLLPGSAFAAKCGNNAAGFEAWKTAFTAEAKARGIGSKGLNALAGTSYATKTISADRGQKSFKLSLDQFMAKRGAAGIASKGKSFVRANQQLFNAIEKRYGVPPGPLAAIIGMETGFGGYMGNSNIVSAVATLAYDCRRSEFFTRQLYAALQLVDRGSLSSQSIGAAHGEVGQTQFLPENVIKFGVDGDGDGRVDLIRSRADALHSTANFLRGHGWSAGGGYQKGQGNFRALQGWNAAGVYQQAIAIIGAQIDGD